MNVPNDHERTPWLAWPSVLSLDAMMVAVVWQQLLMRGFCHRGATWPECLSLGATVWLIYVADRLLDAARLDLNSPHTLRHGFYLRHRRIFLTSWILVLAMSAFVVAHYLPHELLRAGLLLAAAVLIYGASVHFSPLRSHAVFDSPPHLATGMRVPKEIRVGVLFAMGVSLSVWTALIAGGAGGRVLVALAVTTCVLAVLFGGNCVLVAKFERELDQAQSFASIVTEPSPVKIRGRRSFAHQALAVSIMLPAVLLLPQMPPPVLITTVISAIGLGAMAIRFQRSPHGSISDGQHATFDARGAWVDAAVWAPPLTILLSRLL